MISDQHDVLEPVHNHAVHNRFVHGAIQAFRDAAVPGHFGFKWLPAGENGSTGATSAFPNLRAIAG